MKRLEHKHPRAIRWCHWINVPLLALMIWSGLLIYWANDVYRVGWGDFTLFKFFPEWFYDLFGVKRQLAKGMAWHFAVMWLFAANGVCYVAYTFISGEWRHLIPNRQTFRELIPVILHELRLSKMRPPRRKFNAAQQVAYTAVVLMGAGSLLTGLAIYKPVQLSWLVVVLGGYQAARLEHFLLTLGYVAFVVLHLIQVMRAGWNNLRAMITGYELVADDALTPKEQSHG